MSRRTRRPAQKRDPEIDQRAIAVLTASGFTLEQIQTAMQLTERTYYRRSAGVKTACARRGVDLDAARARASRN